MVRYLKVIRRGLDLPKISEKLGVKVLALAQLGDEYIFKIEEHSILSASEMKEIQDKLQEILEKGIWEIEEIKEEVK